MVLSVAQVQPSERALFIRKTYTHVAAAVAIFTLLEMFFFSTGIADTIAQFFMGSRFMWLGVIGGFALLGWMARSLAAKAEQSMQYIGFGIYILAQAIIFIPLLFMAVRYSNPDVLPAAAIMTLALFGGLTAIVLTTKKDFSFLGGFLKIGSFIVLGLIVASAFIGGLSLGIWFSAAMILFAGAAILYDTSKVLHNYRTDQHVGASIEIFGSLALLFWYVLKFAMEMQRS
ncbi:Bax inhibitor-1/YccA family protein [filamentous cyanobacterium LEGE 11480]|uniref:Bax inhibitor-1/YccA family protein n=1 Tax=Romeriopsis navalis LEGE 11480 TaxID=2777977 RepID=A0A928VQB4_9CYAN|nr:Bax inhibitor-1 family protein [Romeriopsis navalis]MBE9032721.1 Bax inhibitor-1/YccA family protein [Romeriopsis navalis LEGE 11480]